MTVAAPPEPKPRAWTEPVAGRYYGLSMREYLAIDARSRSDFKWLAISPGAWKAWRDGLLEEEVNDEMTLGSLAHAMLFEPGEWEGRYVVAPRCHRSWKDETAIEKGYDGGRETWAAFLAANPDAEYVTQDQVRVATEMAAKARRIEDLRAMLDLGGESEVTYVWQDAETGVWLKTRPDRVYVGGLAAMTSLDGKTTHRSVKPRAFSGAMASGLYHIQGELALNAIEIVDGCADAVHMMLALQTSRPYAVEAYRLAVSARETAQGEIRRLLRLFKKCVERDDWPDSSGRVRLAELSPFYKEIQTDEWHRTGRGIDEIEDGERPF